MGQTITLTVNGVRRSVEVEDGERLIDVLRERLGLTGTKRGCDDGSCGACVVVVDGKAERSCLFLAAKADGREVRTIEGMADGRALHPVQEAMIEAGAVQCGYCIPGIVMELDALFSRQPDAPDEAIVEALARHLCRCTGYEAILEGARLARRKLAERRPA
ncbi:MAG: (2Fe-2S)-binding protein [bacterium]|nr:(2Fe-2S)-binding protein [bacterium]